MGLSYVFENWKQLPTYYDTCFQFSFFHNKKFWVGEHPPQDYYSMLLVSIICKMFFIMFVSCVRVNHVLFIVSFMCSVFVSNMFCYRFLFVSYMCHVFVSNNVIYVSFICFIYVLRLLCHFCVNDISFITIFASCYFSSSFI